MNVRPNQNCNSCGRSISSYRSPFSCTCSRDVEEGLSAGRCSLLSCPRSPLPMIKGSLEHADSGTLDPATSGSGILLQKVAADTLQGASSMTMGLSLTEQLPLRPLKKTGSSDDERTPSDPSPDEIEDTPDDENGEASLGKTSPSHQLCMKMAQWLGKKKKKSLPLSAEHHAKVHYGLRTETLKPESKVHDPKAARKRFADVFRRAVKGGSLDEGRRLIRQQESGYSSPNASAQQTPTATHRLVSNPSFMRRSLELSPQRSPHNAVRPRMSLPAEHIRRTLDGRFSAQAVERRRRLSRGKTISQDEGFVPPPPSLPFVDTTPVTVENRPSSIALPTSASANLASRRMSRPGSSSREESTGEESGFEEEEPIEIRVPPLVMEERRDSNSSNPQPRDTSDPLAEWTIHYDQLEFGHIFRRGSTTNIYRGRWHGDVMIHTFDGSDDATSKRFWELVSSLSMIRHENIVLFMGACTFPPNLAIVTGVRRGMSLHFHHVVRGSLPYQSRVNIARQMAQAMSYLHSRGIIHGHLNSRNVFLEAKIKLSLLDHSMAEAVSAASDTGRLAYGLLTYHPPEMMRQLVIAPPLIQNNVSPTQQTDVYMYGTLLYELFAETPPFQGQNPHAVIYQIGTGLFADVQHLQCAQAIKALLVDCWHPTPAQRPVFPDILQILQKSMSLHRTHSTSEPERLNKIGHTGRINC